MGKELKNERELHGWSQAKVAEALNTTVRTISRWEQGQALPYPYYREQLCELFGKDTRELGLLPEPKSEHAALAQELELTSAYASNPTFKEQLQEQCVEALYG